MQQVRALAPYSVAQRRTVIVLAMLGTLLDGVDFTIMLYFLVPISRYFHVPLARSPRSRRALGGGLLPYLGLLAVTAAGLGLRYTVLFAVLANLLAIAFAFTLRETRGAALEAD